MKLHKAIEYMVMGLHIYNKETIPYAYSTPYAYSIHHGYIYDFRTSKIILFHNLEKNGWLKPHLYCFSYKNKPNNMLGSRKNAIKHMLKGKTCVDENNNYAEYRLISSGFVDSNNNHICLHNLPLSGWVV